MFTIFSFFSMQKQQKTYKKHIKNNKNIINLLLFMSIMYIYLSNHVHYRSTLSSMHHNHFQLIFIMFLFHFQSILNNLEFLHYDYSKPTMKNNEIEDVKVDTSQSNQ